jgi:hypothetical protein
MCVRTQEPLEEAWQVCFLVRCYGALGVNIEKIRGKNGDFVKNSIRQE